MSRRAGQKVVSSRKPSIELLEFRRLLANGYLGQIETPESLIGESEFQAPLESLGPNNVFPLLRFAPPLNELADGSIDFANRFVATGTSVPSGSSVSSARVGGGGGVTPLTTVFLANSFSGYEGDTPQFQVRSNNAVPYSIEVSLSYAPTQSAGAISGVDYLATSIITIPAYTTFVGVSVPFYLDSIVEGTEAFSVRISGINAVSEFVDFDPTAISGTIYDRIPPCSYNCNPLNREVSIANASGTEGINQAISFELTASNSGPNAISTTVNYVTVQRSATMNQDYYHSFGTVTFSPNESTKWISIPIFDDTIVETSEYFEVVLSNPSSNSVIRQGTGVGTIIDNDVSMQLSIDDAPVVREGNASRFRVWVNNPIRSVTGTVRTVSGSATGNIDYQGGDYPFSIPAGQRETWISVPTYENTQAPEAELETFSAQIISATGQNAISRANATGSITESTPVLSVYPTTWMQEGDSTANYVSMLFMLPQNYTDPVWISYTTEDRTALSVSDYQAAAGTLFFARGWIDPETNNDYSKFLKIYSRPDFIEENPTTENFVVKLGEPSGATLATSRRTHTMTIEDDDDAPSLSIEGGQAEEGQPVPFVLKLNKLPVFGSVSLNLQTEDGSAVDGIGETEADYFPIGANSPTITLTQLTTTITVNTVNDSLFEPTEEFKLRAFNVVNARLPVDRGTGTILDNESKIRVDIGPTSEIEGDNGWTNPNKLRFDVTLTRTGKAITSPIDVFLSTIPVNQFLPNGSPNPNYATPGIDYASRYNHKLTFGRSQNSQTFDVDIFGDWAPEQIEHLYGSISYVNLGAPTSGTVIFEFGQAALGKIIDDDEYRNAQIAFDFKRILEEEQNCVCTSAEVPDGALVSAKDGGLTTSASGSDLEFKIGGTNSESQIQSIQLTRNANTNLPDVYEVTFNVGGSDFPMTLVNPIAGDSDRRLVFTIPLDLALYTTGMYQGSIKITAKKSVTGGDLAFTLVRGATFKVINNGLYTNSEYSPYWWNPRIERLYPKKSNGDVDNPLPDFSAGAMYVRGDQTAWWFNGSNFATPNGLFAKLRKIVETGEYELRLKTGEIKLFSSSGMLKREMDRNGNETNFVYIDADSDGIQDELSTITDPLGRQTKYLYDSGFYSAKLREIQDFSGRSTLYTIVDSRLTRISPPDPDDAGPRTRPYTDFTYLFNATGGFISMTNAEGLQTKYRFNAFGRTTQIELPNTGIWKYQYLKDKGTIVRLPNGASTGSAIVPGEMESIVTNPRNFQTKYQTDRFGFPTRIQYPNEAVETFTRNDHGQPLEHVYPSPSGSLATATYSYDTNQNLTQLQSPDVGTMIWQVEPTYSLPVKVSATGRPEKIIGRDAKGNVTSVTTVRRPNGVGIAANPENRGDPSNLNTNPIDRYDVNNDGLVSDEDRNEMNWNFSGYPSGRFWDERPKYFDVDEDGTISPFDFLALNNFLNGWLENTPQRTEYFTYTTGADGLPKGMVTSYTNASGETYGTEYYAMGTASQGMVKRKFRVANSSEINLQAFVYNADLNLISETDLYGRTTQYNVDRLDLVTTVRDVAANGVDNDRPLTQMNYSVMGDLLEIVDPAGQTTSVIRNIPTGTYTVTISGGTGPNAESSRSYVSNYDKMWNRVSTTDPLQRTTLYEFDEMDRNKKTTLPAIAGVSSTLHYEYNKAGYVVSSKDILGTTTVYQYSDAGDQTKVTKPNPSSPTQPIEYISNYSSPGILSSTVDPLGFITSYITDDFGNLATIVHPKMFGPPRLLKETISYDSSGRILASTDLSGQFELRTLDLIGRVTKIESIDPDGSGIATRPTYQFSTPQLINNTLVQNITYPDGRLVKTTSDLRDRLISVEMPKLNQSPGTVSTNYQYDVLDRVTSETSLTGAVTKYDYNRLGQVKAVIGSNHLTGQADSAQYRIRYDYDLAGRLASSIAANDAATVYRYDELDRPISVTEPDPDGNGPLSSSISNWSYNLNTLTVSRTGTDGDTTTTQLDALGRTIATTKDGGTTVFGYDRNSQLIQLTDPRQNVTKWVYDAMGRVSNEEQVGIGSRSYSYKANGQISTYVNRAGEVINWTYNVGSQPTQEIWSASSTNPAKTKNYEYDSFSRLTKISEATNNQISWSYNSAGLVTNETTTIPLEQGSVSQSGFAPNSTGTSSGPSVSSTPVLANAIVSSMTSIYDAFGRNSSKQLSVNGTVQYTDILAYDMRDRLTSTSRTGTGDANQNMWTTFQYNNLDQVVGSLRGTGATVGNPDVIQTISRDLIGRATQYSYLANSGGVTTPLDTYSMQYVSGSNRLASLTTPNGTTTYDYTSGGQLSRAGTVNYLYDANGNPTSRAGQSTIIGSFNRLMDDGSFTYSYDAEGRTTSRTNKQSGEIERYQWNQASQLSKVDVSPSAMTSTVVRSVKYGYDQIGRRSSISKTSGPYVSTSAIDYLLSDGDQVAQILDKNRVVQSRFMYGPDVDMVLSEQAFVGGAAQGPKWQLTDHLGTVRGVTQKSGSTTTVANRIQYDAFGKLTSQSNATLQPRFGFAGRDIESVGDMTYNRNRYYSTSSGRFVSQDPIGFNAGDANLYRYVGNGPTNATDPSGLHGPGKLPLIVPGSAAPASVNSPEMLPPELREELAKTWTADQIAALEQRIRDNYETFEKQKITDARAGTMRGVSLAESRDIAENGRRELLEHYSATKRLSVAEALELIAEREKHSIASRTGWDRALFESYQRAVTVGQIGQGMAGSRSGGGGRPRVSFVPYNPARPLSNPPKAYKLPPATAPVRGRRGTQETRDHIDQVRDEFLHMNPDYRHVAGGRDRVTGQKLPEEYLPPLWGGKRGGSYPDLTFEGPNGERIRINTTDVRADGTMSPREQANFDRIFEQTCEPIIGIPKPQ